jgi:G3E family GTPase
VFLAEPVGSCTDLRASVQYPLRRLYGDDYRIAPLSVLVDPIRAMRILGMESGTPFSRKVVYVYAKQLEEAELIVVNKSDLLSDERRLALEERLRQTYPRAHILSVSARSGAGLDAWFRRVAAAESDDRHAPDLDYELYAEGEALLGWVNATVRLAAPSAFDGNRFVFDTAREAGARLTADAVEIAHLKMTLTPDEGVGDLAVLNRVGSDRAAEVSHRLEDDMRSGELIVNLRAEGDPELLRAALLTALESVSSGAGVHASVVHLEHFRPTKPSPTHRFATA